MTKTRSLALLLGAALLASCGDSAVQVIAGPLTGSRVRFFNFGVNAPGVYFYANDTKMTAIGPTGATTLNGVSTGGTESVTGTIYGGVGSSGFYSDIAPGSYKLSGKIAAATDYGLIVSSLTTTIAASKNYSFYMSGFYDATAKTVEGFIVEDPFPDTFDWANASVRFVNAISNSSPMILFAKNTTTGVEVPVGSLVAYKGAGAFAALPQAVYDLSTRTAGSSTNTIVRTAVSFNAGRTYTISARGDITIVSTTLTNRPFLDNTTNR